MQNMRWLLNILRKTPPPLVYSKSLLSKLIQSIAETDKVIVFLSDALQKLLDMSAEQWGVNPV